MNQHPDRRRFLQASAATGISFWIGGASRAAESTSPNSQVQVACIGLGGKGGSDSRNAARHGKIVAVCDIDRQQLERAGKRFQAETFTDFRQMLDQLGDRVDAVTISTPDHIHALAAAMAIRAGKHVFCQKPLTHSIYEARLLSELAREKGVSTQMGNQFTALDSMRKTAHQIRDGQLGNVSEVHIWTDRPVWPQGEARPPSKPVPAHVEWDQWIGPAPYREYADGYHPFKWRGWWDFGTGALGDMACHTCNLPFMALNMRNPTSVQAVTSGHDRDSYPSWSKIDFEFPELGGRAAFRMHWYDGSQLPPQSLFQDVKPAGSGVIIVGDKGTLYAAGDYAQKGTQWIGVEPTDVDYPKAGAGNIEDLHVAEWFAGMEGGSTPMSNFPDYAGPLTETILLGNLAVYAANQANVPGKKVAWDAANLVPTNAPELAQVVKRDYRDGWELA
ncbi:MAG: Gfo/Idh/MocA family oxidoreductase [Planctomycetales bacterium]|nr:Gfo/Idh/MocA family oxidoreductase [Planctomycetales bacterium]NIM07645.1 Gfo/Idh/MocA family oxidoreductase [Planctomycetales bacterium]NIN07151.1 Gfo/Idh/MocA family oxidoreductase [Planctomycetales bacterium]NIN76245.1 Gfo/Idh/MocA family oxidoreductase [Planctomycetales bacterium]NIO33461.1 Gfo/Idh/MocA family oxidoreductase [Planctomycetales bacterium]